MNDDEGKMNKEDLHICQTAIKLLQRFDVDEVRSMEKCLSKEDKISLLYLLCDDASSTLQQIKDGFSQLLVTSWCNGFASSDKGEWKLRLIESLTLIQNFKALKVLGYEKIHLSEVQELLNRIYRSPKFDLRKALFTAFDKLTEDELSKFISAMDQGLTVKDPLELYLPRYIEIYLLEWQIRRSISLEYEPLCKVASVLNDLGFADPSTELMTQLNSIPDIGSDETSINSDDVEPIIRDDIYPIINEKQVGLCIIINQENYSPQSDHKPRRGSQFDCTKLANTMKKMRIYPVTLKDLTHDKIFPSIEQVVRDYFCPDIHSVLFVVIMSHGEKGRIIGVDNKPVDTDLIRESLSIERLPSLKNKPKIIIFQSCRGNYDFDVSKLEADGREETNVKISMDNYLICWSTIPGFKSYRDPYQGSLYIQTLCDTLEERYMFDDFLSILTRVHRKFSKKHELLLAGMKIGMMPEFYSALSKDLFLYKR